MKPIIPPRLEAVIRARLGVSAPAPVNPRWQADGRDPSEIRGARSHPRRRRKSDPRASGVLSDAEIARTLMRYRYDRAFRGERRVPIQTLADYIGLSHETVYRAMRGKISDVTRAKLSWAIVAIADGRVRFRRHRQVWQMEYRHPD